MRSNFRPPPPRWRVQLRDPYRENAWLLAHNKALGGGMRNRQADDQNDVGWGILPGNFERHLTQLRPEETSVGLWNVGPPRHPYGLFARRFDSATGRTTLSFRIADGFVARPGV